jgi:hypothetical protein
MGHIEVDRPADGELYRYARSMSLRPRCTRVVCKQGKGSQNTAHFMREGYCGLEQHRAWLKAYRRGIEICYQNRFAKPTLSSKSHFLGAAAKGSIDDWYGTFARPGNPEHDRVLEMADRMDPCRYEHVTAGEYCEYCTRTLEGRGAKVHKLSGSVPGESWPLGSSFMKGPFFSMPFLGSSQDPIFDDTLLSRNPSIFKKIRSSHPLRSFVDLCYSPLPFPSIGRSPRGFWNRGSSHRG